MPAWRIVAIRAVRGIGIALGAALALIYLYMICDAPPTIDWPRARLKTVVGLYVITPALLIGGAFWLSSRLANLIAPPAATATNDKEADR